jgi:hypothetical protein
MLNTREIQVAVIPCRGHGLLPRVAAGEQRQKRFAGVFEASVIQGKRNQCVLHRACFSYRCGENSREINCRYRASREAKLVETALVICPLGIAEIGQAVGESFGCNRRPYRIRQILAGFHHDDQIAVAGDVETKLI